MLDKTTIRLAQPADFDHWKVLYRQYLAFYKTSLTDQELERVWSWFFDPQKQIYCHLAIHQHHLVGLTHFREFLRPLKAATAVFMDDLYVDTLYRDKGIAQMLIQSIKEYCIEKNIPLIRWITAHDNETAMRLYNKIATQTQWQTYDLEIT
jgi:ribosomal protein S18 acetylase RimI-like enzyme